MSCGKMKYSEEDMEKIVEESCKNEERVVEFSEKLMLQKWSILAEKEKILLGITGEKDEKGEKVKTEEGKDVGERLRQEENYQVLMEEIELLREQSSELVEKLGKSEDEIEKLNKEKILLVRALEEKEALEKTEALEKSQALEKKEAFKEVLEKVGSGGSLTSPQTLNFDLMEDVLSLKMKLIASEEREKLMEATLDLVHSSKSLESSKEGEREIRYKKMEESRKEAELTMELKSSYEKEAKLAVKLEKLGEEVAKQVALLVEEERRLEGLGKELELADSIGKEGMELLRKERRSTLEFAEKVYKVCVGNLGDEEELLFAQAWEAVEKTPEKKDEKKDKKKDMSRERGIVEKPVKISEELEEAKEEIENLKKALESADRRGRELEKSIKNPNNALHEESFFGKRLDCSKEANDKDHLVWEYEDRDDAVRLQMKLLGIEELSRLEEGGLLANLTESRSKTFENMAVSDGEEGKKSSSSLQLTDGRSTSNGEEQENVGKDKINAELFLAESKAKVVQLEKKLLQAKKIGKEALIEARAILQTEKDFVRANEMVNDGKKDAFEKLNTMLNEKVAEVEELRKQLNGRSVISTMKGDNREVTDFYLSEELQLMKMKHIGELERARLGEISLESEKGRVQQIEELQRHVKELEIDVLHILKKLERSREEEVGMKKLIAEWELKENHLRQQVRDLEKKLAEKVEKKVVEKVENKSSSSLGSLTSDGDCFDLRERMAVMQLRLLGSEETRFLESVVSRNNITELPISSGGQKGEDLEIKYDTEELIRQIRDLKGQVLSKSKEEEAVKLTLADMEGLVKAMEKERCELLGQVEDFQEKLKSQAVAYEGELNTVYSKCSAVNEELVLSRMKLLAEEERKTIFCEEKVASFPVKEDVRDGELVRQIRELEEKVLFKSKEEEAAKLILKAMEKERCELLGQVEDFQKKVKSQAVAYEGELDTISTKYCAVTEELVLSRMKLLAEEERRIIFGSEKAASFPVKEDMGDGYELKFLQGRISELEGEILEKTQNEKEKEKGGKEEWEKMRKLLEAQQITGRELLAQVSSLQQNIEPLAYIETVTDKQTVMDPFANSTLNEDVMLLKMKLLGEEEKSRLGESIFDRKVEEFGVERRKVEELVEALQECVALVHSKDQVITEQVGIISDLTHLLEVKEHSLDESEHKEEELEEVLQHAEKEIFKQQEMGQVLSDQIYSLQKKLMAAEERLRIGEGALPKTVGVFLGEQGVVESFEGGGEAPKEVNGLEKRETQKQKNKLYVDKDIKVINAKALKETEEAVEKISVLGKEIRSKEVQLEKGTEALTLAKEREAKLAKEKDVAIKENKELKDLIEVKENGLLTQLESVKQSLVKAQTELQEKDKKISELMAEALKQPSPSHRRQSAASALLEVTERMKEEANELREESRNAVREKEFFRATAERNEQKAKEAMAKEEQSKTEIAALQKTIQVFEKRIDEAVKVKFEEDINRLKEQQVEAVSSEREKGIAVKLELENRVANLGAYTGELEKKTEVLGIKLQQELKLKDEKKSAIEELQKELNILTSQNKDFRAQKTWTEGKMKRLEEDLMSMEKKKIEKESEIRLLVQKVEASMKELDVARREVKRGEEKAQQLGVALKEKATLEEKVRGLQAMTKVIEKQLSVVTTEREDISRKANEDIARIQKTLNGALAELRGVSEERDSVKMELQKSYEVVNMHLKSGGLAIGEKVKLETALQLKKKEVDDLRKKVKGLETELRLMGASDGNWAQEVSLLREQLEKSVKEREEAKKAIKKVEKAVELAETRRKEEVGLLQVRLQKEESESKALLKQLENVQKVEEEKCADLQKLSEVAAQQERQLARMNSELEKLIGERTQLQSEVTREKQRAKQQLDAFTASADAVRRAEVLSARTEVEGRAKKELMEASGKRENAEREVKKLKAELEEVRAFQGKEVLKWKEEETKWIKSGETEKGLRIRERAGYQKKLHTVQNEAGELRKRVEELKEEMSSLRASFSEEKLKEKVARAFADAIASTGVSILSSLQTFWFRQKLEKIVGPLPTLNKTEPTEKSSEPPSPKHELVSGGGGFENHTNGEKHTTTVKRKGKKGGKRENGTSHLVPPKSPKSPKYTATTREKRLGGLENIGGLITKTGMDWQFFTRENVLFEVGKVTAGALLVLFIQQLALFFSSG